MRSWACMFTIRGWRVFNWGMGGGGSIEPPKSKWVGWVGKRARLTGSLIRDYKVWRDNFLDH